MSRTIGTFFGIGVGPGDPELITLKALNILRQSPVIAVPTAKPVEGAGRASGGMAREIVESAVGPEAMRGKEVLALYLPMTRDVERLKRARIEAAGLIAGRISEGKDVAFVTLGDPMLFSTFGPLLTALEEEATGVRVEVVPGISAVNAMAALLKAPLASADQRVAIIPAAGNIEEVKDALTRFDTVVLLKVNSVMDELIELLEAAGLSDRCSFVSKVTWPDEKVTADIKELKGVGVDYFSMLVIRR